MPLQVVTQQVSVYRGLYDDEGQPLVRDGAEQQEERIFARGQLIPEEWVDSHQMFVLTSTGMAKVVEEPDPSLRSAFDQPRPVLLPEHSPRFVERTGVVSPPRVVTTRYALDDRDLDEERPAGDADKAAWERYAANSLGMNRAEAESLSDSALRARVKELEQGRETEQKRLAELEEQASAGGEAAPSGEGQPGEDTTATRPADQSGEQAESAGKGGKGGERADKAPDDAQLPRAYPSAQTASGARSKQRTDKDTKDNK